MRSWMRSQPHRRLIRGVLVPIEPVVPSKTTFLGFMSLGRCDPTAGVELTEEKRRGAGVADAASEFPLTKQGGCSRI